MTKINTVENSQRFPEENRVKNSITTTRMVDKLHRDKSNGREHSGFFKPERTAKAAESGRRFRLGDKVKNNYGRLLTVLVQLENLVYVKEEVRNYNPKDLIMIETSRDTYPA